MNKMAGYVIFSVLVACSLHQVFANNCLNIELESVMNCNDCIRCGGYWCNKPRNKNNAHCSSQMYDNWCPEAGNLEELPEITEETIPGVVLNPGLYSVTVKVDKPSARIPFSYNWEGSEKPEVHVTLINSTQTENIEVVETKTVCVNGKCTSHVSVMPETSFCSKDSGKYEFVNMRVRVENVTEEAVAKFHVPCACPCNDNVEKNSGMCNGNGDFSCGVCICHKGWSGLSCETRDPVKCERRGDNTRCVNPYKDSVDCSGNGHCGPCDTCICYDDREGSQYFREENYCADLCLIITSECEMCLHERPFGKCTECPSLTVRPLNETLLSETDHLNRKIWVNCQETIDGCNLKYVAMRDENDNMFVMKKSSCNAISEAIAGGGVNVMLPTVLGALAVLAAVGAAAGYAWHRARAAPARLAASQYRELDPPASTGINPLYKPPTSSYNNPMWKGAKV